MGSQSMRVFEVSVEGFGSTLVNAVHRGAARYDAYLCDAFSGMTFGEFIRITRVRLAARPNIDGYEQLRRHYPAAVIPAPGTRITAEGMSGVVLPALRSTAYVIFQPDGQAREARVHPYSVALCEGERLDG